MRVGFAGTPEFARVALEAVSAAGFELPLVLTQPDRPAGRGLKLQPSPVKAFAQARGIAVSQPRSLRLDGKYPDDAAAARQALIDARPDVLVVAAYGLILPQWVLDLLAPPPGRPKAGSVGAGPFGCLNIHASLLPRWRGAAPIHRAIEAGDVQTGITIMQMDAGLDTGDMLLTQAVPIGPDDSTARLHDRLAALGGRLIVQALRRAEAGTLTPIPQPAEGVSYAHKVEKSEAAIDWHRPAAQIAARIRAFDPFPGATGTIGGEPVKLWAAQASAAVGSHAPGSVISASPDGIAVATGDGIVTVTELQRAGGKRLPAADFLRGFAVEPGQAFG